MTVARWLHSLGAGAARRPWTVVLTWLVLLVLGVAGYLGLGGELSPQVTLPGTPTAQVADQLAAEFPDASGGSGTVVFHADDGSALTADQRAEISDVLERVADVDGVRGTVDPFATEEQRAEQAGQLASGQAQIDVARAELEQGQAQLDAGRAQLDALPPIAREVPEVAAQIAEIERQQDEIDTGRAELEQQARQVDLGSRLLAVSDRIRQVSDDGSTVLGVIQLVEPNLKVTPQTREAVAAELEGAEIDGVQVALSQDLVQEVPEIFGPGEALGLLIAAITLVVLLGATLGAVLPIVSALVGLGVGVTAALSTSGVIEMISVTPVLGVMLGLAVGIDYSLFLINRHRGQLLRGMPLRQSIALSTGTAGTAVVFAGLTVVIALVALNVTGIDFLGLMGTVGALCVLVAVAVAVTLTPAALSLLGLRVLRRRERLLYARHDAAAEEQRHRLEEADHAPTAPLRTGRAWVTLVLGTGVLVTLAVPALSMRLGLPDGSAEARESTQFQAFDLTDRYFGPGTNGPLLVIAEPPQVLSGTEQLAEQVRVAEAVAALDDVVAVAPVGVSGDQRLLAFQVVPAEGPSSESTARLVTDLRALSPLSTGQGSIPLGVAGSASGNIDISVKLTAALPGYLALVVGLSLVLLVVVFRSILVPLTATVGFVLSLFATFGAITAIFQWGWLADVFGVTTPGPVLSFLPTIVVGILFGLAMDYQLFLVSGMREAYAHGAPPRQAVTAGLRAGRRVVVAAAIIMVSVFAGFIGSDSVVIRSIGFALAFGVLVDAFVVRMLLIPAVMHLVGSGAWWLPRGLDRVIPDVDVEGASLQADHGDPVAGREPAAHRR